MAIILVDPTGQQEAMFGVGDAVRVDAGGDVVLEGVVKHFTSGTVDSDTRKNWDLEWQFAFLAWAEYLGPEAENLDCLLVECRPAGPLPLSSLPIRAGVSRTAMGEEMQLISGQSGAGPDSGDATMMLTAFLRHAGSREAGSDLCLLYLMPVEGWRGL